MSRLSRIVCDNPDCKNQVEWYAGDYYQRFSGMEDTPEGWYRLNHQSLPDRLPKGEPLPDDAREPFYFCSITCVRAFTGQHKAPHTLKS